MATSPTEGTESSSRPRPPGKGGRRPWARVAVGAGLVVALAAGIYFIVRPGDSPIPQGCGPVRRSFRILSGAMLPTLRAGDHIAVANARSLSRGDIVVFAGPEEGSDEKDVVKRVIALPGETVEAKQGQVLVNGSQLSEPYLGEGITTGPLAALRIPADQYFVLGDNRGNSKDSRFFGPVPRRSIIGVAVAITAPSARARALVDHCA